jgi:hypothetical protein
MFRALSHDFVLRRNIRVGLTGKYHKPEPFLSSTYGCHHIRLVNHTASLWNALLRRKQPLSVVEPNNLATLPELRQINSNEAFGIVSSENAISFGGLFEIKEEDQNDFDLHDDAIGPGTDDSTHQVPDAPAHIDPALVAASCLPPPPTLNLSIVDSMVTSLSRAVPRSVGTNFADSQDAIGTGDSERREGKRRADSEDIGEAICHKKARVVLEDPAEGSTTQVGFD